MAGMESAEAKAARLAREAAREARRAAALRDNLRRRKVQEPVRSEPQFHHTDAQQSDAERTPKAILPADRP